MTLRLNGDSSGYTEIKAADTAGDNSIKLPAGNGSANELLKNSGTAGELEFATDVVVDNSGRLLVGTPTFVGAGGGPNLQVISDDGADTRVITMGDNTVDPKLHLGVLNSGTSYITWGGYYDNGWTADDTGDTLCIGAIQLTSTTSESSITFRTQSNPNTTPLDRVEIRSDGMLSLKSDCPGIDFSGIQTNTAGMTSEVLDGYEEGTFTPELAFGGNSVGVTYNSVEGTYTKIGRFVFCTMRVDLTSKGTSTGQMTFEGLPFAVGNVMSSTSVQGGTAVSFLSGFSGTAIAVFAHPWEETSRIEFHKNVSSFAGVTGCTQGDVDNDLDFRLTVAYMT